MAITPDRHPGEADEEGMVYENLAPGNDPTALGGQRFVNGDFRMKDQYGVFNPRSAATIPDLAWRRHFLLMGG